MLRQALAADRTNSTILAAVADTRIILDQDYSSGGELALIVSDRTDRIHCLVCAINCLSA